MSIRIDTESVRDAWNEAADPYVAAQAAGRDHYRYEFFGPAQVALCGDVSGARLLDVACGGGYFAREMAARGAHVSGADISPRMIEHARRSEAERPLGIVYDVCAAESLADAYAPASFDVVTSCLALQDVVDPPAAWRAMHHVLRPGGRAIVSISHPCTDTPHREWLRDASRRKLALAIDRYFDREVLETQWTQWDTDATTAAHHAPLEDWFDWILGAGFTLRAFREPRPTDEAIRVRPRLADAARVPYYAMFVVDR